MTRLTQSEGAIIPTRNTTNQVDIPMGSNSRFHLYDDTHRVRLNQMKRAATAALKRQMTTVDNSVPGHDDEEEGDGDQLEVETNNVTNAIGIDMKSSQHAEISVYMKAVIGTEVGISP